MTTQSSSNSLAFDWWTLPPELQKRIVAQEPELVRSGWVDRQWAMAPRWAREERAAQVDAEVASRPVFNRTLAGRGTPGKVMAGFAGLVALTMVVLNLGHGGRSALMVDATPTPRVEAARATPIIVQGIQGTPLPVPTPTGRFPR